MSSTDCLCLSSITAMYDIVVIICPIVAVAVVAEGMKEEEQEPAGAHRTDYSTIVASTKQQLPQSIPLRSN